MFLIIARTLRQGFINFIRNGWLSLAAVSVLLLSLYLVGVLFVILMTANSVLKNVEEKINVSIYFKSDVSQERIMSAKSDLENFQEIKSVDYVSKEKALEDFKRNNADEPVIIKSLEEIGENPLLASLVVKANNPNQYQAVSDYVTGSSFNEDVSRVNYGKNKEIINRLNSIIYHIKRIGLALMIIFGGVSVLIIFNTIRITIFTHRQEIEVMRLVGASNTYIRLPYIYEGMFYGIAASLIGTLLLFITIRFVTPYVSSVVPTQNLVAFYVDNLLILLGIQAAIGVFLGIFSSWIAISKYLKV